LKDSFLLDLGTIVLPQGNKAKKPSKPVANWTNDDVILWLDSLGFYDMLTIFQKNLITGQALLDLTFDEMKTEMGITALGIRKTILREIQLLNNPQLKPLLPEISRRPVNKYASLPVQKPININIAKLPPVKKGTNRTV